MKNPYEWYLYQPSMIKAGYNLMALLAILTCSSIAVAQQHTEGTIDQAAKKEWIVNTLNLFSDFSPDEHTHTITSLTQETEDFFQLSYRVTQPGCIYLENGDWVYLVSSSSHQEPVVGDLTLAIDNNGRVFQNEGHVCGGIIHFILKTKTGINSASDFFDYFTSDTDDKPWVRFQ